MSDYSHELENVIRETLDSEEIHYDFENDKGYFRFGISLPGKIKRVDVIVDVKMDKFVTYAICPLYADIENEEQMARAAEFFCRVNYGLMNGNFELDFNDGEIRYKSFVNCDGVVPSATVIMDTIQCAAAMYSRYGKGLLQILFNDWAPEDAVNFCENKFSPIPEFSIDDDEDEKDEEDTDDDDFDTENDDAEDGLSEDKVSAHLFDLLHRLQQQEE